MRIDAVRHAVPNRQLTNDDWREFVRERLSGRFSDEDLGQIDTRLNEYLDSCGSKIRHVRSDGESAIEFALDAGRQALDVAGADPDEMDFVIYAGVSRGWLEPATACALQHELGLVNATAFDVLDACASWLRAMQIAEGLLGNGTYRRGLIVNCECGLDHYLHMEIDHAEDIESRLACFTIGEAATATVVSADGPDSEFYFRFHTYGRHYRLCMIPLDNADGYLPDSNHQPLTSQRFFAESSKLVRSTIRNIVKDFRKDPRLSGRRNYDAIFSHAASATVSHQLMRKLELPAEAFYETHERFGNTVAASVPLAMSLAEQEGRLKRGDDVLVVIGSAGITVGFATFRF